MSQTYVVRNNGGSFQTANSRYRIYRGFGLGTELAAKELYRNLRKRVTSSPNDPNPDKMPRTNVSRRKRKMSGKRRVKSKRTLRRRTKRRRGRGRSNSGFSTKGFKLIDRQWFGLDFANTNTVHPGQGTPTSYNDNFWRGRIDDVNTSVTGLVPLVVNNGTNNVASVGYNRFINKVTAFTTTSGIMEHFNKYKVEKITHNFFFPDQQAAADASNTRYPTKIGINYGDKYRVTWDGTTIGNDSIELGDRDIMERPGWKWFNVKRMNKLSISYAPRLIEIREAQNTSNTVDIVTTKQNKYTALSTNGTYQDLLGPTIAFDFGQIGTTTFVATTPTEAESTAWNANQVSLNSFFQYTKVQTIATINFKDRNASADD